MRRKVQVVGWALIWSGVFLFGYLGWQLLGTGVVNAGVQREAQVNLQRSFETVSSTTPVVEEIDPELFLGDQGIDDPSIEDRVPFHPEDAPEVGEELAFLRIPKIEVDEVVFQGVDVDTLKMGPGHMPRTALPGQPGNAVVSGHRTTYGSPFFDLDLLEVGDQIEVETAIGHHLYEVREVIIVEPTDVWVTRERPGGWLTLTTCNPKFSARERLIVFAEMVSGPNIEYIQLHEQKFG